MSEIIGAKSVEQVDDNLVADDVTLNLEEVAKLNAVTELPSEYSGWMQARQDGAWRPRPYRPQPRV